MPFLNAYKPPAPLPEEEYHAETPPEEYDLNFVYSAPERLETPGGVRLEPFVPSLHGRRLYDLYSQHPSGFLYLPYGPFPTYAAFLTLLEKLRRDEGTLLFAVFDLALDFEDGDADLGEGRELRRERIAGIVGVLKSRDWDRMTEIGHLHIPPPFQRTHVLTHSISLLLHWILDPPSSSPSPASPLGLRRAQWFANALNTPSVTAAQRLGFVDEATHMGWDRVLPPSKTEGVVALPAFLPEERRKEEEKRGLGRHSACLGLAWDRWEENGRDKVDALVAREVKRRKAKDVPGLLE
ncbi:hypothetical protein JCM6882_008829 [Rhodosporidiobolus microsporus]